MNTRYTWSEAKRQANIAKHGLDFMDADLVLENPYKLEIPVMRNNEACIQAFAYVFGHLAVLSLAYVERGEHIRIISFRKAGAEEREMYHAWLENHFDAR